MMNLTTKVRRCQRRTMRRKTETVGHSACSCSFFADPTMASPPIPNQEPATVVAKQPTTTIELVFVLG